MTSWPLFIVENREYLYWQPKQGAARKHGGPPLETIGDEAVNAVDREFVSPM
jgi:hypothetical protein